MKKYLLAFLSTASIEAQAQPTALLATGGQCAAAPCAVTAIPNGVITTGKSGSIGTRTARSPPREHRTPRLPPWANNPTLSDLQIGATTAEATFTASTMNEGGDFNCTRIH